MTITRRAITKAMVASAAGGLTGSLRVRAASARERGVATEATRTQVCVIGGGSGGIGAALAAARAGARVVLVEFELVLGGTSTNAWVHTWEPTAGADGLPREIYERMKRDPLGVTHADYDRGAPRVGGQGLPFEPRVFNYAVREMLTAIAIGKQVKAGAAKKTEAVAKELFGEAEESVCCPPGNMCCS